MTPQSAGPAAAERRALADTLAALGPDAATLLDGWATADLAAHLVVRESQPLALPGLAGGPFGPLTARLTARARAGTAYGDLVERFRHGPPVWSLFALPGADSAANLVEFFVHHEDARRGPGGVAPRELPAALAAALDGRLPRLAPLLARRLRGVGLRLALPSGREVVARRGPGTVTAAGPAGELLLLLFGRQDAARVELAGEPAAVARVRGARLGL